MPLVFARDGRQRSGIAPVTEAVLDSAAIAAIKDPRDGPAGRCRLGWPRPIRRVSSRVRDALDASWGAGARPDVPNPPGGRQPLHGCAVLIRRGPYELFVPRWDVHRCMPSIFFPVTERATLSGPDPPTELVPGNPPFDRRINRSIGTIDPGINSTGFRRSSRIGSAGPVKKQPLARRGEPGSLPRRACAAAGRTIPGRKTGHP